MNDYRINIFYSADDEGYIAHIPELEHCYAFGLSPIIALHEVLLAKEKWIQDARAKGIKIPVAVNAMNEEFLEDIELKRFYGN